MKREKIIKKLNEFKKDNPNQEIIVETPEGMLHFKIEDALIYESPDGKMVFDSE